MSLVPDDYQNQINLAEHAAKKAVEEFALLLGIDARDPIKAQRNFAALSKLAEEASDEELLADAAFVRKLRKNVDTVTDTSLKTAAKWFTLFVLGIVALGTKEWWLKHITG